ncbi:MAG: alpha/beta hydrolase [Thermomicrobiales bacterium]
MPRAEVNGIRMNYEVAGEGPPLVLIHAWPTDHAVWQLQVPVFSQYYRTIAVDLRGCGQSDKPTGPNTPEIMSDDIVALLDTLGYQRAAVAGISLGGIVAAQMTLDHPGRVVSSIWVGAPSDMDGFQVTIEGETMLIADAYMRVLAPEGYLGFWEKVWKANIGLLFNEEFVQSRLGSYLIRSVFEERYGRFNADPSSIINIINGLRGWTIRDRLSSVSRPVQVVVGNQDPTFEYCKEQGQQTAGAEYVQIDYSGHFSILDQPARFNEAALDFLRRTHS